MENKAKLLMEIGLQRDEDHGDVSVVAFDVPIGVAKRVCEEQEKCQMLSECGELTRLLNSYALVNGYQCAWFISASVEEYSDDEMSENAVSSQKQLITDFDVANAQKQGAARVECTEARDATMFQELVQSAELMERLMKSFMHCRHSDTDDNACDGCPYEEVKYCASEQARDGLILFALWKTELEDARKDAQAHELAGKLFEKKNSLLEAEVKRLSDEISSLKKDYASLDGENRTANTKQYNKGKTDGVRQMQAMLKTGRIHFDGISLKAIPFDSVDAVAERIIREICDGTKK